MDAKFFSSIKKYKKSNTIGFDSVPLNIKIGFFGTYKEHTFFGFPHICIDITTVEIDSAGNFTAIMTLTLFLIFFFLVFV